MASEITTAPTGHARPDRAWLGYLLIALAAVCWGAAAPMGRAVFTGRLFAGEATISPLVLAQTRTTLSLLLLLPILLIRYKPRGLKIARCDLARCVAIGTLGLAASNFFYYLAIEKTTVATAIILQYTAPVWVLLYMVARRLQPATMQRVVAVALAVVGSALAIGIGGAASLELNTVGLVAAQLAALSFAFYNIAGQRLVSRISHWIVIFYALASAAVFWMFINPPWVLARAGFTAPQWGFLLLFAIVSMLLPFSFYFSGLKFLDPTRAIVTSCLEPVFAIGFAAIYVGEALSWLQGIGVAVVIAATVLIQMPERALRRRAVY